MNDIESKIKSLNIKLPEPKAPVGAYVATKIVGKLLYISGQISIDENAKLKTEIVKLKSEQEEKEKVIQAKEENNFKNLSKENTKLKRKEQEEAQTT